MNPERDVGLVVMLDLICEAFFGMEPRVDFLWWIFTERASLEGRLLTIVPVEGSMPTAAQVSQFIKFGEISSSHGDHTSVAAPPPRSYLDCMRRSGAPCSSAEHLSMRRPGGIYCVLVKSKERSRAGPGGFI